MGYIKRGVKKVVKGIINIPIAVNRKYTMYYVKNCKIKNNKIVFQSFSGKGYSDNPRYISDEFIRRGEQVQLVWLVNDTTIPVPEGVKKVAYGSCKALRELASAKVWIDNVRNSKRPPKKAEQILLQTWHGSHPVKPIEKQAEKKLPSEYVKLAKEDGINTTAILVDCASIEKIYRDCFWLNENTEYLRVGMPRTDYLIKNAKNNDEIRRLRNKYQIEDDAFVVLYAPTFRDDGSTEGYIKEFESVRRAFEKKNQRVKLLVRLHPSDVCNIDAYKNYKDIKDVTKVEEGQEIVLLSDCVITDYSSISFEFAVLRKPVFIYERDIDDYRNIRGLTNDYDEWPFEKARNMDELVKNIENYQFETYNRKLDEYYSRDISYDDGDAAEKVVDWLLKEMRK